MAVRKILFMKEDDGSLFVGDVIEHEQKLWLVPEWLPGSTSGTERPARIVCLDDLPLETPILRQQDQADWVLGVPLNSDVLAGRRVSKSPLVIERPDIILRTDTDFHRYR